MSENFFLNVMDNQERLNLNESSGLNKNKLAVGSATATLQLVNETQTTTNDTTLNLSDSKVTSTCSKNKICLSTNKNADDSTINVTSSNSKHKINSSTDYLTSKTFECKEETVKDEASHGGEAIPLKNLKKKSSPAASTNTNQVKINLIDEEKPDKAADTAKSKNEKTEVNNRKRFLEINFPRITRKTLKRPLPCLFAWTLLVGSTGAYFALVSPKLLLILDENYLYWLAILAAQALVFVYVLVNFLVATLRDPGRFPKVVISPDDPSFNDDTKSPLYKSVTIKKTQVKIKWCSVMT